MSSPTRRPWSPATAASPSRSVWSDGSAFALDEHRAQEKKVLRAQQLTAFGGARGRTARRDADVIRKEAVRIAGAYDVVVLEALKPGTMTRSASASRPD